MTADGQLAARFGWGLGYCSHGSSLRASLLMYGSCACRAYTYPTNSEGRVCILGGNVNVHAKFLLLQGRYILSYGNGYQPDACWLPGWALVLPISIPSIVGRVQVGASHDPRSILRPLSACSIPRPRPGLKPRTCHATNSELFK